MSNMNLLGFKRSKGDFDGVHYDTLTIYTILKMEQKENQRGSAGAELRCEPSVLESLQKIDFSKGAVPCDVNIEKFSTGKGQTKEMVVSVSPVVQK